MTWLLLPAGALQLFLTVLQWCGRLLDSLPDSIQEPPGELAIVIAAAYAYTSAILPTCSRAIYSWVDNDGSMTLEMILPLLQQHACMQAAGLLVVLTSYRHLISLESVLLSFEELPEALQARLNRGSSSGSGSDGCSSSSDATAGQDAAASTSGSTDQLAKRGKGRRQQQKQQQGLNITRLAQGVQLKVKLLQMVWLIGAVHC